MAQYYGLAWLSYRDAVFHGLMADTPGLTRYEIFPPHEERHPTPLGHKYATDLIVGAMQRVARDAALAPMADADLDAHPLAQVLVGVLCLVRFWCSAVFHSHTGSHSHTNTKQQTKKTPKTRCRRRRSRATSSRRTRRA